MPSGVQLACPIIGIIPNDRKVIARVLRLLWFLCIAATLWFALIPASMGGLGGSGYHGLAFVVLGLLTPAAFPRWHLGLVWLALVALAGGIEVAQEWTGTFRHGEWGDFGTGVFAAGLGVIYAGVGRVLIGRLRDDHEAMRQRGDSSNP